MTTVTRPSSIDLSRSLILPDYALTEKFGVGPDFSVYTGAMKPIEKQVLPEADRDLPVVDMRGSSTIKDLQDDIMSLSALRSMQQVDPDLVCWLNHSYDVPDSIYGKLYSLPKIEIQGNIADLWIASLAFVERNPAAKRTYEMVIKDKARLGCSVGCMVTKYHFANPDDPYSPIIIDEVVVLEWSVVGIPANLRCWVENGIKGRLARSLVEGDGDTALQLTPAYKGLYPRDFTSVVEHLTSEALRKDMQRIRARGTLPQRIMFSFTENGFYLEERGMKKSLTREETSALLEKAPPDLMPPTTALDVDDLADTTKAVSGKTSWPLMDIGTEWTGSKAEQQIFAWARNDQDEIVASQAKQCFLWYDPDKSDKQSGYKMPITYVDGSPKIVPLGCRAAANVLAGGMGGGKFGGDEPGMKGKCETLYGRINSEFNPDPKWVVPWKKEDAGDPDVTKALGVDTVTIEGVTYAYSEEHNSFLASETKVLDTTSGSALNRQDLGEIPEDETKSVAISADGTHDAFSGVHTHSHTASGDQGGDAMHSHEHSHSGEANHGHSHEKAIEPDVTKALELDGDGNHHPFTGTHTHKHKAFGADDASDDGMHSHEHEHDGDTIHRHSHKEEKHFVPVLAGPADGSTASVLFVEAKDLEPTPEQLALLAAYNTIGKQIGFPAHTLTTKCDLVPTQGDAGIVRSTLLALDDVSDALELLAQRNDGYVDALMGMLGVPDVNDGDEGAAPIPLSGVYSIPSMALTVKEGREISGKNQGVHQQIHDLLHSMHPDGILCKNGPMGGQLGDGTSHQDGSMTVAEAQEEARQIGQGDSYSNLASLVGDALKTSLAKALEGVSTRAIVEQSVHAAVDLAMKDVRTNMHVVQGEQRAIMEALLRLKNVPLGPPTNLSRTIVPSSPRALDNIATYEEMLGIAGLPAHKPTLKDALALTTLVEVPLMRDGREIRTRYRRWGNGVGGTVSEGVRPPLTDNQKTLMHWNDWAIYNSGGPVDVPVVDDPAESLT